MCECVALGSATRCMRINNATLPSTVYVLQPTIDSYDNTSPRAVHLIADHNPTSPAVSGSKRQGSPCTLGERPTATHPRELEYACSIFYCESPVPVCFIVHSSQIAVTGRERGRGTIILHGRRSTSCCPLSGKETVRTAAIGQRSRTLKVNFLVETTQVSKQARLACLLAYQG